MFVTEKIPRKIELRRDSTIYNKKNKNYEHNIKPYRSSHFSRNERTDRISSSKKITNSILSEFMANDFR